MKTVRTALGIRRVEDSDPDVTLFKVRQLLDEQRVMLINRLAGELVVYIDYRFKLKPTERQLEAIRERLASLKKAGVDLERYHEVCELVLHQQHVTIPLAPFYHEIDENILNELNPAQLKLV